MPSEIMWEVDEDGRASFRGGSEHTGVSIDINRYAGHVQRLGQYYIDFCMGTKTRLYFPTLEEAKAAVPGEICKVIDALYELLAGKPLVAALEENWMLGCEYGEQDYTGTVATKAKIEVLRELLVLCEAQNTDPCWQLIGTTDIETKIAELEAV